MVDVTDQISHEHGKKNFFTRWFMSTNHKDIGILYIFTAALLGFIAVAFTVYMRLELMEPGVQYMTNADGQPNGHMWNVLITGHGVLMMFFVVIPALFGGFGNYLLFDHNWTEFAAAAPLNWQDARLQNNETVAEAFFMETGKDRYLKQSPSLFEQLGFTRKRSPRTRRGSAP